VKTIPTYTANVYVGLRHSYTYSYTTENVVRRWLKDYCTREKTGVTLTPTEFIYVDGAEPGVIIGLIRYPRFPKEIERIEEEALAIAKGLMELCRQERVSVVFPDRTVMLEAGT